MVDRPAGRAFLRDEADPAGGASPKPERRLLGRPSRSTSAGTSCQHQRSGRALGASTRASSAGAPTATWIWARWANIASSSTTGAMIGAIMRRDARHAGSRRGASTSGVDDIDRAARGGDGRAGGGTIHRARMEIPGGEFIINGTDPQGAAFGLVGPRKQIKERRDDQQAHDLPVVRQGRGAQGGRILRLRSSPTARRRATRRRATSPAARRATS